VFLESWVADLSQIVESMAGQRPITAWRVTTSEAAGLDLGPATGIFWSHQILQGAPGAEVWLAAPQQTWEFAASLTLRAAGLDPTNQDEVKSTWREVLGQWTAILARSLGSRLQRQIVCENGSDDASSAEHEWLLVSLRFGETELPPLAVAFSSSLISLLVESLPAEPVPRPADSEQEALPDAGVPPPRSLDLLLDVELPVSISFGKAQLPLKEVLKLTTGSIVELNRGVSEPVDVLVNHCLVARGEVVVVEGNYGVRIQHIVKREERLRGLR
jgi:flagellar motor switch protein FliN/FliY